MTTIAGVRIHVTGIVQGVGFRPFIYGLARRHHLAGWVRNTSAGVEIELDGPPDVLAAFGDAIRAEAPPLSRIDTLKVTTTEPGGFSEFKILESENIPEAFQPISADVAVCPDCLREMHDHSDRRFRYPFINCTNCGPRFTIIKDIPYDRPLTTMSSFEMCLDCAREYADPGDRRFHAQPVACPRCGPHVWLERAVPGRPRTEAIPVGEAAIGDARRLLGEGHILAIKGLGGFHLACDATNPASVRDLRNRKLRVDKPFAIMVADAETAAHECEVSAGERLQLESIARPIVLLKRKAGSSIALEVAPGQDWLGVMLPYTPLHHLLLEAGPGFPHALVMTSGNLSEEPIVVGNDEARERLAPLADALLLHDREIHIRCDDSVVRIIRAQDSATSRQTPTSSIPNQYTLRRSRGFAPFPVRLPWHAESVLAVGAELKNTFCLTHRDYGFLSHHIGDLENYDTLVSFEAGVQHFERLFRIAPVLLAHDLHPDYLATRYAFKRSLQEGIELLPVQHHHAHIAACMAENGLDGQERVIGMAFDGTGYGSDGTIWGGEILLADYEGYDRRFHLRGFPLPGGDAAIKSPARIALALLWSLGLEWPHDLSPVQHFSASELETLQQLLSRQVNAPCTSSMGRLFDAAASLAGVRQQVNYEAQAVIEFEALADPREQSAYTLTLSNGEIDPSPAIAAMIVDRQHGVGVPTISARFHNGVATSVLEAAVKLREDTGINMVALSGGVWQNITLLRRTLSLLGGRAFRVYIHREVPTNDGGLSLGQAVIAAARLRA